MKFFKQEIKMNPEHVLSNSIFVTARSCVNSHDRWYAELKLPGAGYAPIDTIQGSKKMIKVFIAKWLKSHS